MDHIDDLTKLLNQCLGRIDEQAWRLLRGADGDESGSELEDETAKLQQVIAKMLVEVDSQREEAADLNRVLARALDNALHEIAYPVVTRQSLGQNMPKVGCRPAQLASAVHRALMIALRHAGPGGEIALTTRAEEDQIVFEIEARGVETSETSHNRVATLREFVTAHNGNCHAGVAQDGTFNLALELPVALATDS